MGRHHHQGAGPQPAEGQPPFLAEIVQAEPDLRRDLDTSLQLGISPHRYSGWEPTSRTTYRYRAGLLVAATTSREPEWDDVDRALIDAYRNWQADLHVCGRPLSESLHDPDSDKPDPDYQVGVETCRACMALDKHAAGQVAADKPLRDAGRNPDSWRLPRVLPFAELEPADQQAILRARQNGRNGRPG